MVAGIGQNIADGSEPDTFGGCHPKFDAIFGDPKTERGTGNARINGLPAGAIGSCVTGIARNGVAITDFVYPGASQCDRNDASFSQGAEFPWIGDSIAIPILPDPEIVKSCVTRVKYAVVVAVERGAKPIHVGFSARRVYRKVYLTSLINLSVTVKIDNKKSVVGTSPADVLLEPVVIQVEKGMTVAECDQFGAISIQVKDNWIVLTVSMVIATCIRCIWV